MKQRYMKYASQIQPSEKWKTRVEDEMLNKLKKKHKRYAFRNHRGLKIGVALCLVMLVLALVVPQLIPPREDITVLSHDPIQLTNAPTTSPVPTPKPSCTSEPFMPDLINASLSTPVIIDGFYAQNVSVLSNATLLLSGYATLDNGNSIAAIRAYGLDGSMVWEKQEPNYLSYRDAEYADSNTLYAIAVVDQLDNGASSCVIQRFQGDQLTAYTDAYEGLNQIYFTDDGLWVASTELENSQSFLRKFDLDLNLVYELVLDGHVFLQVLTGDAFHVAYGYLQQQETGIVNPEQSVLFAFDNSGHILWEDDSTPYEAYIGAAWTEAGKFVLLGRTPYNGDPDQFFSEYFVSEYDTNYSSSRIDLKSNTSVDGIYRNVLSIHSVNNGYLLSLAPIAGDGIPILYVNTVDDICEVITSSNSIPMSLSDGQLFRKDNVYYLVGSMGFQNAIVELFSSGSPTN